MKTSIAMATYNGAAYLQAQLDSLIAQSRQPDELVVSDDVSSDDTLLILDRFANSAPFEVRISQNEINFGYARNFCRALSLCSGDLIFLSDQDDIWFPDKISTILNLAKVNPDILLFMNDAELTQSDGVPIGLTKLGQVLSLGLDDSSFATGCCMALRKPLVELALPVPAPVYVHDTWLNKLALSLNAKKVVLCEMQYYRRHDENTSDWLASRKTRQSFLDLLRAYNQQDRRLYAENRLKQLAVLQDRIKNHNVAMLQESRWLERLNAAAQSIMRESSAVERRLDLLEKPRWRRLASASKFYLAGQYAYFSGLKSFLRDAIFP